jgi:hypothetical protein
MLAHHNAGPVCGLCEEKLKLARQELVDWFHDLKSRNPTVHVSWGYRDQQSQEDAFAAGTSRLHFPTSAHNRTPSDALDIFQINSMGQAVFDPVFFRKVSEEIIAAKLPFIWGGVFRSLGDFDHFQYHTDT